MYIYVYISLSFGSEVIHDTVQMTRSFCQLIIACQSQSL